GGVEPKWHVRERTVSPMLLLGARSREYGASPAGPAGRSTPLAGSGGPVAGPARAVRVRSLPLDRDAPRGGRERRGVDPDGRERGRRDGSQRAGAGRLGVEL